jgi:nucleoside-diphosphate-sugar epimerase
MNILVTGGSGFIGTRLIENLLKDGHTVKIFDKHISKTYPKLTIQGDVRNLKELTEACKGIELVYNLAAEHADNVTPLSLYKDVNVDGAQNLITAVKENHIKNIIFTSSVAVYPLNAGDSDETSNPAPFNEYGTTKLAAEKIFKAWEKEDKNNSLFIVRPAAVFGETNRGNIYNLLRQINSGKFVNIGKGNNRKSIGYVGNIAAFLASLATKKTTVDIYNYADKPDMTAKEMADYIQKELGRESKIITVPYFVGLMGGYTFDILSKLTGKKFPVSSIRVKKFTADTSVNTTKLENSGFKRPYTLQEGFTRTIKNEFLS